MFVFASRDALDMLLSDTGDDFKVSRKYGTRSENSLLVLKNFHRTGTNHTLGVRVLVVNKYSHFGNITLFTIFRPAY